MESQSSNDEKNVPAGLHARWIACAAMFLCASAGAQITVTVPAKVEWTDTGIFVEAGDRILVMNATGGWSNAGSDPASMKGALGFDGYKYPGTQLAEVSLAALIGRVGSSAFQARPDQQIAAPASGRLYLGMNDVPGAVNYDDNDGSLNVVLRATPMRLPDLQGRTLQEAGALLRFYHQVPIPAVQHSNFPPEKIFEQQPPAGTLIQDVKRVDVQVSDGPGPPPVPPGTGPPYTVPPGTDTGIAFADLSLTVASHEAESLLPGALANYQITVHNAGRSTATNVVVSASSTNIDVKSVDESCPVLPCTLTELAPGADATLNVRAVLGSPGKFSASFQAAGAEQDPNPTNNAATIEGEIPSVEIPNGPGKGRADLAATLRDVQNERGYPAEPATFYFVVENKGPADATHVKFDHSAMGIWVDSVGSDCEPSNCVIPAGASITVQVNATHESPGKFGGELKVTAAEPDPDPENNIASFAGRTKTPIPWIWITCGAIALLSATAAGGQALRKRHWRKLVNVHPTFDPNDISSAAISEMPGPPVEVNCWLEFGDAAPTTPIRVTHEED